MSLLAAEPVLVPSELASLQLLLSAVADAVASPPDSAVADRLRVEAVDALARFPVTRKDRASVDAACRLVEAVVGAGWNDLPATAEVVREAERACGQGWTGLLTALLLAPAWQIQALPSFDATPLFLWRTLATAYFRLPDRLVALGQGEALASRQLARLRELARLAKNNAGSAALREAAAAALSAGDLRLLASSDLALGEILILRGRLRAVVHRRSLGIPPLALPRAGRRLKIGVVVQALGNNRRLRSILPWFEALDPARFEVVVFFPGQSDDWSETYLNERAIAVRPLLNEPSNFNGQLQAEGLDVALFAADASDSADWLPILASDRVAPLQGVLDEFGLTSGLAGIDVLFRRTVGAGAPSASERLLVIPSAGVRLYPSAWCGAARQKWDRAGLGFPEDAVVFSSAAPFALLSPEWADQAVRLLRDHPEARLLIHSGAPEDAGPSGLARLCAVIEPALVRHQVGAAQLMISNEPLEQLAELSGLLGLADVHLDSYPLGDAEGCLLALGAGVPVLNVSEAGAAAATPELRAALRDEVARSLASPPAFSDPLAFGESVGAMLEQVFDLAAADETGAVFRGQPPLELSMSAIPEGGREEAALLLEAGLAAETLTRVAPWFAAEPADSRVRTLYYSALIQGGQARRALHGLSAALERKVAEAETCRLIARARLVLGQPQDAMAALRRSLSSDAKHPETWAVLSEIATAGGHHEMLEEIGRMRAALTAPAMPARAEAPLAAARSLYFSPVGKNGKVFLTRMLELLPAEQFDVLVVAYDDTDFSDLGGRIEVIRDRGHKWRFVKKYLTPEKIAGYEYVFIWDDDLDPKNFEPAVFLDILRRNRIDVAQPSLTADSFSFHPITVAHPGPVGRLTNFVEIMCPVYSGKIWPSIYPYIDPEINELGWGYDLIPLGRKAIIDCMSVRHTRPGQSANAGAAQQSAAWCERHQIVRPALVNLWNLS